MRLVKPKRRYALILEPHTSCTHSSPKSSQRATTVLISCLQGETAQRERLVRHRRERFRQKEANREVAEFLHAVYAFSTQCLLDPQIARNDINLPHRSILEVSLMARVEGKIVHDQESFPPCGRGSWLYSEILIHKAGTTKSLRTLAFHYDRRPKNGAQGWRIDWRGFPCCPILHLALVLVLVLI